MPNSIRTTSNTQTTTNSTPVTFKAGDSVLCPSLSAGSFILTADSHENSGQLVITFEGSLFRYNEQGYFVAVSDMETDDFQPSLFHDTPANCQAIATLYSTPTPIPNPIAQSSQRKIIDATDVSDDEVILISSMELSDIACDINGSIGALNDIGTLLWMIYQEKVTASQAASMARLSHDATDTWVDLLCNRLNAINKPLAQSTFGSEVAS